MIRHRVVADERLKRSADPEPAQLQHVGDRQHGDQRAVLEQRNQIVA